MAGSVPRCGCGGGDENHAYELTFIDPGCRSHLL